MRFLITNYIFIFKKKKILEKGIFILKEIKKLNNIYFDKNYIKSRKIILSIEILGKLIIFLLILI
jgi:hypothetical protein